MNGPEGDRNAEFGAGATQSGWRNPSLEHAVPELAVMANVLNPETESITLNTELETPTLEPATSWKLEYRPAVVRIHVQPRDLPQLSKHPLWTPMP